MGNGIDLPGITEAFRNEFAAALFRHGDIVFFKGFVVDVGKIHVVEFHAA